MGDVCIGDVDHFEVNKVFEEMHRIPPRRGGKFMGMTYKRMIAANDGIGFAKKHLMVTRATLKCLLNGLRESIGVRLMV